MGYFEEVSRRFQEPAGEAPFVAEGISEEPTEIPRGATLGAVDIPMEALLKTLGAFKEGGTPAYKYGFKAPGLGTGPGYTEPYEPTQEEAIRGASAVGTGVALALADPALQALKFVNPVKHAKMLGESGHIKMGASYGKRGAEAIHEQPGPFRLPFTEGKQIKGEFGKMPEALTEEAFKKGFILKGGVRYQRGPDKINELLLSRGSRLDPQSKTIRHEFPHFVGVDKHPHMLDWAKKKLAENPTIRRGIARDYRKERIEGEFLTRVNAKQGVEAEFFKEYTEQRRVAATSIRKDPAKWEATRKSAEKEINLSLSRDTSKMTPEEVAKLKARVADEKAARPPRKGKRDPATEFLRSKGQEKGSYIDRSGVKRREPSTKKRRPTGDVLKDILSDKDIAKRKLPGKLATKGGTTPSKNLAGSVGKKRAWKSGKDPSPPQKVVSGAEIRMRLERARVNVADLETKYPGLVQELQKRYGPREKPRTAVAPKAPEGVTPGQVDVGFAETEDLALQSLIDQLKKERGQ